VILAQTIKGYGLGEAGEGRNVTHQQKKLNEDELREFRTRFNIPISDEEVAEAPFYKPPEDSEEMEYLRERRENLGGSLPTRRREAPRLETPTLEDYKEFAEGSGDREVSTTMAFVRLLGKVLRDKNVGKYLVPIVPDESRTFGMEALFRQCGIYAHTGQLYEPVDSDTMLYYREAKDGQILEEGITEAGSMASFNAAGTAYSSHGVPMIPVFIYYSMFGFQRVGDLIWAAGDMQAKGFLVGGTAGRTTLNGEGLQHEDGHSQLFSSVFPTIRSYDPSFGYEVATIFLEGMKRLYQDQETAIYYLTVENENYAQPAMPEGAREGILKGLYKYKTVDAGKKARAKVGLMGSGAILRSCLRAADILAEKYNITSDVYSATSYTEIRRDCQAVERWNRLHPGEDPRSSYLEQLLDGDDRPFVAASDYVKAVSEQIDRWVPGGLTALGTDGFGRSDSRTALRRFFEVDAESIVVAALYELARRGEMEMSDVAKAIEDLDIDPDKPNPLTS
jgi:pyruvate dehydrogenase E1 component